MKGVIKLPSDLKRREHQPHANAAASDRSISFINNTGCIRNIRRIMVRQCCSWKCLKDFGLLVGIVIYSVIGAAIFLAIESPHEDFMIAERNRRQNATKQEVAVEICSMFTEGNQTICENEVAMILAEFEIQNVNLTKRLTTKQWTFLGALSYVGTIYTTIGYGHLAPATTAGRACTIVYAIFGIPMILILLARLGRIFCYSMHKIWSAMRVLFCHYMRIDETGVELDVLDYDFPMVFALALTFGWLITCSALFLAWEEDWGYFSSFYFSFISLTTIGLGDVVPKRAEAMLANFVFIIIGLAMLSMCIALIQIKIEKMIERLSRKIESKYVDAEMETDEGLSIDDGASVVQSMLNTSEDAWLATIAGRQLRNQLVGEWKRRAKMRHRYTQVSIDVESSSVQCELLSDETVQAQLIQRHLTEVPYREIAYRSPVHRSRDDFHRIVQEVSSLLSDCQGLVTAKSQSSVYSTTHTFGHSSAAQPKTEDTYIEDTLSTITND